MYKKLPKLFEDIKLFHLLKYDRQQLGKAPGTITDSLAESLCPLSIQKTVFNKETIEHCQIESVLDDFQISQGSDLIYWFNITGTLSAAAIEHLGRQFNLHALTLEEIQDPSLTSKYEEQEDYTFLTMKTLSIDHDQKFQLMTVQILIYENCIITFNDHPLPLYLNLQKRIYQSKSKLRKYGVDYFTYALLDIIGDTAYNALNHLIERIEVLEEQLMHDVQKFNIQSIYHFKKYVHFSRQALWGQRDIIVKLQKSDNFEISDNVSKYYQSLIEHFTEIGDIIGTLYTTTQDMFNLYMSLNSNKMNEIMKVLTVFAAIFIPLTFIAGIYGMNFEYMPELKFRWGYPVAIILMFSAAIGMLIYFKKRKWF